MADLLALADAETRRALARPAPGLHGGTRAPAPARGDRRPLRGDRPGRGPRVQRRRGGDLRGRQRPAGPGRPRDRRLAVVPEPARDRAGGRRGRDAPRAARGGRLGDRPRRCCAARSRRGRGSSSSTCRTTRRGRCPDVATYRAVADIAADAGATLLVRRGLPLPGARPAGPAAGRRGRGPARRLGGRDVEVVRAGRPADRLAGEPRRPAPGRRRAVQGLHDDLRLGAGGDPGADRAAGARDGAGPLALHRGREPRRCWTRSSTGARSSSAGSARAAGPSASRSSGPASPSTGSPRTSSRPRACCWPPARSSATRATTSASASAGPTCRRRSPAWRPSRTGRSAGPADPPERYATTARSTRRDTRDRTVPARGAVEPARRGHRS